MQKSRCHKASAWNSYGSLRSCPCSFGFLFCRTEVSAKAFFQPETPAKAAAASVTPPFRMAGRNNCNLYNIISKCPECKLKWRKSTDLFASKMESSSIRRTVSDENAGTGRAGTPEERAFLPHRGTKQGALGQPSNIHFCESRRGISAVQMKTGYSAGFKNALFPGFP